MSCGACRLFLFAYFGEGELKVAPDFAAIFFGVGAKDKGRVVGGHEGDAAILHPGAADFHDAFFFAGEVFDGGRAEGDDDAGADDFDLTVEDGEPAGGFFGDGRAVFEATVVVGVGAAEFDDVGDVDAIHFVIAFEAHRTDHFVEELSAASDEGASGAVFFDAGAFADEEDLCIGIAFAEDEFGGDIVDVLGGGLLGFGEELLEGGFFLGAGERGRSGMVPAGGGGISMGGLRLAMGSGTPGRVGVAEGLGIGLCWTVVWMCEGVG